jgi:hypothetical protein
VSARELEGTAKRWLSRSALVAMLGSILATQSGCELILIAALVGDDDTPEEEWIEPPPTAEPAAPEVEVEIADWPPIGPNGVVTVHAFAENGISQADFAFRNEATLWSDGNVEETFLASGSQLGEGYGDLTVRVSGADGAWTEAFVTGLVVDLSPPEVHLGATTLPAQDATFDFWMGDAWVVWKAELDFGGVTLTEELPPGYPTTVGTEWDYSLVRFDVIDLPAVTDTATITLTDAAGNVHVEHVTLSIDGAPPAANVVSPRNGDVVRGAFEVEVEATDSQPGPLVIDLYAGGTIVATGNGPSCTFVLSAAELAEGALDLEAIAIDEAGNRSVAARASVVVAHDAPPTEE